MLVLRASLDVAAGDFERAAQVLGASRQMEDRGVAVGRELEGRRDRALGEVRANLGEAEADSAIESGRQVDDQGLIELITG